MNVLKTVVALGIVSVLSGCAPSPQVQQANNYIAANSPVKGANKAECDLMWQKTQYFIMKNSTRKMQMATDVLIETHNTTDVGQRSGSAMRMNNADGSCEIEGSINMYMLGMDSELTANMIRSIKSVQAI
ncbi:TPA: hypothetical protein ACGPGC_003387 [Enterobacter hormaechei]|uniref:hypothetical protein n=1 Tax=Enterobacter cloacae TaxID=550 RepID=UPI0024684225|nr:hypothetical protein [Enterobacter cloacae]WGL80946.1 hypothetical protein QFB83_15960 [Enterobacter cloacae]